jgi:hypothetical protein
VFADVDKEFLLLGMLLSFENLLDLFVCILREEKGKTKGRRSKD